MLKCLLGSVPGDASMYGFSQSGAQNSYNRSEALRFNQYVSDLLVALERNAPKPFYEDAINAKFEIIK